MGTFEKTFIILSAIFILSVVSVAAIQKYARCKASQKLYAVKGIELTVFEAWGAPKIDVSALVIDLDVKGLK